MSSFDFKLHVFRSPQFKGIVNDAIKFFAQTPVHALPPPHRFVGTGVYALYYTGDFKPYARIAALNKPDYTQPIYVGKAVPEGRRTARAITTVGGKLLGRLREHAKSIQAATNLNLEDFHCRFMILTEDEADLIELVEARLIRNYKPLWNSGISGFGIHSPDQDEGRKNNQSGIFCTPEDITLANSPGNPHLLKKCCRRLNSSYHNYRFLSSTTDSYNWCESWALATLTSD